MTFSDGHEQVDDSRGVIAWSIEDFEVELGGRIQGGEVVEEDFVAGDFGGLAIDFFDFEQSEVALAFLGGADGARDAISGAQAEASDLGRGDVNVVGSGKVIIVGRTQEAEAIGQAFENAFPEDTSIFRRLALQKRENKLLFTEAGASFDIELFGELNKLYHRLLLQLSKMHGLSVLHPHVVTR